MVSYEPYSLTAATPIPETVDISTYVKSGPYSRMLRALLFAPNAPLAVRAGRVVFNPTDTATEHIVFAGQHLNSLLPFCSNVVGLVVDYLDVDAERCPRCCERMYSTSSTTSSGSASSNALPRMNARCEACNDMFHRCSAVPSDATRTHCSSCACATCGEEYLDLKKTCSECAKCGILFHPECAPDEITAKLLCMPCLSHCQQCSRCSVELKLMMSLWLSPLLPLRFRTAWPLIHHNVFTMFVAHGDDA